MTTIRDVDNDLRARIDRLANLSVAELRQQYAEHFGDSTRCGNKPWLIRRIAWRLQALAEGGLSERAKQRAAELANEADLRLRPPRTPTLDPPVVIPVAVQVSMPDPRLPAPGAVLVRTYKGAAVHVHVLADGFEYAGERYRSLSAVAKAITGSHCNGFHFFGLTNKAGDA